MENKSNDISWGFLIILIIVVAIVVNLSNSGKESSAPVYGEPTPSIETSIESDNSSYEGSSSNESDITSCPKCGKSYNKATWGAMCNSCWNEGKGLQSNGHDILK